MNKQLQLRKQCHSWPVNIGREFHSWRMVISCLGISSLSGLLEGERWEAILFQRLNSPTLLNSHMQASGLRWDTFYWNCNFGKKWDIKAKNHKSAMKWYENIYYHKILNSSKRHLTSLSDCIQFTKLYTNYSLTSTVSYHTKYCWIFFFTALLKGKSQWSRLFQSNFIVITGK